MYDIKKLRAERSMSQKRLAFEAGVDVRTIRRMERGQSVSAETLRTTYIALGVELGSQVSNHGNPNVDEWLAQVAMHSKLALSSMIEMMRRQRKAVTVSAFALFAAIGYLGYSYVMQPDIGIEVAFDVSCDDKTPFSTAFGGMEEAFPEGFLVVDRKWGSKSCVYVFAAKSAFGYPLQDGAVRAIFDRKGVNALTFPLSGPRWVSPGESGL
jgi:transcriptional regulator with XRE-family HTH domain